MADLVQGEPWRPKGREGGSQGLRAPTEILGNPGPSDQTRHTQRGMAVGSETRSSSFYTVDIHTWSIFSSFHSLRMEPSISDVSALRSSRFSGRRWAGPPWTKAPRALLLTSLSHTAPDTAPPGDGAPGSHPKGFNLLDEPELGKRPMTFLPPYSFLSKERRRGN